MFISLSIPTLAPLLVVVPLRTPCHPDQRPDGEKAAAEMNRIFPLAPVLTERQKDKKTQRQRVTKTKRRKTEKRTEMNQDELS